MTANEFRGWMLENGLTLDAAAEVLGKDRSTITTWRNSGVSKGSSVVVWLACQAISAGVRKAA